MNAVNSAKSSCGNFGNYQIDNTADIESSRQEIWDLSAIGTGTISLCAVATAIVTGVLALAIPALAGCCSIATGILAGGAFLFAIVCLTCYLVGGQKPRRIQVQRQNMTDTPVITRPVSSSSPRPVEQEKDSTPQPEPLILAQDLVISDPKTIKMLQPFSNEVQNAIVGTGSLYEGELAILEKFDVDKQLAVVRTHALNPNTTSVSLSAAELNHFIFDEHDWRSFVEHFGPRIQSLNLSGYSSIDYDVVIKCLTLVDFPNLKDLCLAELRALETIEGFAKCPNLQELDLQGCTGLKEDMLEKLNEIPNPGIRILCYRSSLVIRCTNDKTLNKQLLAGWCHFLGTHPRATLLNLIIHRGLPTLIEKPLAGDGPNIWEYLTVREDCIAQNMNVAPKQPGEMLSPRGLNYYARLLDFCQKEHMGKRLELCISGSPEQALLLSPRDLSPICYLFSARIVALTVDVEMDDPTDRNGPWDPMAELNMAAFDRLERLTLRRCWSLVHLHNLDRCPNLEMLILEDDPKLDVSTVLAGIFKLHSLKKLTINCPAFAAGQGALDQSGQDEIFANNPNLSKFILDHREIVRSAARP